MSLPRYPEYKESSDVWVGQVPESWTLTPIKHLADFVNGCVFKPGSWSESGTPIIRIENLNGSDSFNFFDGEVDPRHHVSKGDLLFGWSGNRGTSFGPFVWQRDGHYFLNQHIFKISGSTVDNGWFYWCLKAVTAHVEDQATGIIGMVHVTKGDLGAIKVPVPSSKEQHAIATFLDRETAKIDALIAEQEKLLALLAEKRQATISHAVTRGLNPNAPMKNSGIPWLGEVPAHWEFKRIKDGGCEIVDCKNRTPELHPEGDYFVVRTSCVKNGEFSYEEGFFTNRANFLEWTAKGRPQAGDVLFTREAPAGEACLAPEHIDFCLGQRMMYIRPPANVLSSKFLLYAIYGAPVREKIDLKSKGSTVGHLRVGEVGELPLLLPPLSEQGEIVVFLDAEINRLNALAFEAGRASRLFKERRSALISAAVTGKIDVRQVA